MLTSEYPYAPLCRPCLTTVLTIISVKAETDSARGAIVFDHSFDHNYRKKQVESVEKRVLNTTENCE